MKQRMAPEEHPNRDKTKIYEEIITYEQYLKELESDRKKKSTVDNFSVLKGPLTENLAEDEKLLHQTKVE